MTAVLRREHARDVIDSRRWGPRELYRELLRLGARHGRARVPAETPLEYECVLVTVEPFDADQSDTEVVTNVYTRARYGNETPDDASVAAARDAIERLRALDEPDRHPDGHAG